LLLGEPESLSIRNTSSDHKNQKKNNNNKKIARHRHNEQNANGKNVGRELLNGCADGTTGVPVHGREDKTYFQTLDRRALWRGLGTIFLAAR